MEEGEREVVVVVVESRGFSFWDKVLVSAGFKLHLNCGLKYILGSLCKAFKYFQLQLQ